MRGEVPDDADVALVKAEVDAARGEEVELAELAAVEHALDRPHRRAVEESVAAHQQQAAPLGGVYEAGGVGARVGERLLDEGVLARLDRGQGQLVMRVDRRRDQDRVDRLVGEQVVV